MSLPSFYPTNHAFDAQTAILFGKVVQAAYAMHTAQPTAQTPPPFDIPDGYKFGAWITMQDFIFESTEPIFYGVIVHSIAAPTRSILAIRGTMGNVEWWDDVNALRLKSFKSFPGLVGEGFARIYETLKVIEAHPTDPAAAPKPLSHVGDFAAQVADHVTRHAREATDDTSASPEIHVTGHSLGAALTTLYVMDNELNHHLKNPSLCTFASPQVGTMAFVRAFNKLRLVSWRIVNESDPVPMLPPEGFGFRQVEREIAFSSIGKVAATLGCWHFLQTYLALIDPVGEKIDYGCRPQVRPLPGAPEGPDNPALGS